MKPWKRLLLLLCLTLMVTQQASSQALLAPAENYIINRAVAGIIANRIAVAEGVAANDAVWLSTKAANDAVFKSTMSAVSGQMTLVNVAATVAGGALAIAGAPVWLTIAAALGVTALGAYYISSDASEKISITNSASSAVIEIQSIPEKVAYTPPPVPSNTGTQLRSIGAVAVSTGLIAYRDGCSGDECLSFPAAPANFQKTAPFYTHTDGYILVAYSLTDLNKFFTAWLDEQSKAGVWNDSPYYQHNKTFKSVFLVPSTGNTQDLYWSYTDALVPLADKDEYGAPLTPFSKTYTEPLGSWVLLQTALPTKYTNLTDAYPAITEEQKAIPVPADQLAKLADEAWRRAAQQPGYQGLPYSATQPITQADVATWQSAHPNAMPTLGDMLRPALNTTTDTAGIPISPTVTTGTGTTTNPGTNPNPGTNTSGQANLGPDPGVPDPTLEEIPEAQAILNPLTSLFPELRSFQTPNHTAECPKPEFNIFGTTVVMDAQCTIAEQHRAAIGGVMLAVWVLVGLFILLSA